MALASSSSHPRFMRQQQQARPRPTHRARRCSPSLASISALIAPMPDSRQHESPMPCHMTTGSGPASSLGREAAPRCCSRRAALPLAATSSSSASSSAGGDAAISISFALRFCVCCHLGCSVRGRRRAAHLCACRGERAFLGCLAQRRRKTRQARVRRHLMASGVDQCSRCRALRPRTRSRRANEGAEQRHACRSIGTFFLSCPPARTRPVCIARPPTC